MGGRKINNYLKPIERSGRIVEVLAKIANRTGTCSPSSVHPPMGSERTDRYDLRSEGLFIFFLIEFSDERNYNNCAVFFVRPILEGPSCYT